MSELITGTIVDQQIFSADNKAELAAEASSAICVLMPHAVATAGYKNGKVLSAAYNNYKESLADWQTDFFEHQFITEALLSNTRKLSAVFIATSKYLVVPAELYNETDAAKWLKKIEFVEATDTISTYFIQEANAYYIYAWPTAINNLATKYFPNARLIPFAATVFNNENGVHCNITDEHTFATLYQNGKLQWHQVFNFETAEDIAYHLHLLCKQFNIDVASLQVNVSAISFEQIDILQQLGQYFPGISEPSASQLFQQLYTCAS